MSGVSERVALNVLSDFYAPLLTEHRREVLRLYCEEDLSLGEIADQMGITRQGASDALTKARRQMQDYEDKLGLIARYQAMGEAAAECRNALERVRADEGSQKDLSEAKAALDRLLNER